MFFHSGSIYSYSSFSGCFYDWYFLVWLIEPCFSGCSVSLPLVPCLLKPMIIEVFPFMCWTPSWYRRRQWHPTPVLWPGKSHGQRSLEGCSPWGHWGSDMTEWLRFHFALSCIGKGNGNPLQCSCLENPRDGGAWWAAIYGVTQSWTRLKCLSLSQAVMWARNTAQKTKQIQAYQQSPRRKVRWKDLVPGFP